MGTLQMAEHNEAQLSTDCATTPQTQQPVSLATLPNEILAAIIGLLLPESVCNATPSQCYPYSWKELDGNEDPKAGTAPENTNKWSFLYVNQRFHVEGLHFLHSLRYHLHISEDSIFPTEAEATMDAFVDDERSTFSLPLELFNLGPPPAVEPFPGLKLSRVTELRVEIRPTTLGTFWQRLKDALHLLCNEQLLRRGPIKSLVIDLQDMSYSGLWSQLWLGLASGTARVAPGRRVFFEDYEDVLKTFKPVIAMSSQCEMRLPYWMERCQQKTRLLEMCMGEFGARVLFSPAPKLTPDEAALAKAAIGRDSLGEASDRDWNDLVVLPKEYMPSTES